MSSVSRRWLPTWIALAKRAVRRRMWSRYPDPKRPAITCSRRCSISPAARRRMMYWSSRWWDTAPLMARSTSSICRVRICRPNSSPSWCDHIAATRQLIINTTSASGGSVKALQRHDRVVIAATKTGTEKNATVFARYWVEALQDPGADTDKNQIITGS